MVRSPQGPFTCPLPQLWFDTAQSLVVYIVPVSNKLLFYTHLPHPRAWGTDRMSLHLQAVGRRGEHGFRQPLGPVVGNTRLLAAVTRVAATPLVFLSPF